MRAHMMIATMLAVVAGCSGPSAPTPEVSHDPEQASAALVAALDAWKKGDVKSLTKRNPPIRFVDDDLLAGMRLSDYEIEEPDSPIRLHQDVEVILSLRDARGKAARREARYQVGTHPSLSVLRSDR
jgi:hypothetical protein